MSADAAAVLASALAALAAVAALATALVLGRRVAELRRLVEQLRGDTVPLVHRARVVVDQAATEMERVGDVLGSAEAVTATVDSASRLAYRAFSNPVVAVVAFGTGVRGALRRLFGRTPRHADKQRSADGKRPPDKRVERAPRHRRRRTTRSASR